MYSLSGICLKPIGIVHTKAAGNEVKDKNVISKIIIRKKYEKALEGLEEFSHLFVLFWLHQITNQDRKIIKVRPLGRKDLELLGIFATRTPHRPNPIGLTCVKLMKIKNNVLTVQGLDAYNETPVLDIKPFDSWDTTKEVQVPKWWRKIKEEKESEN